MKKILMLITAIAITLSINAQNLKQDTVKTVSIEIDSVLVPQSFIEQGLTPSFYMENASKARLVSLISVAVGCGSVCAISYDKTLFNDNALIGIGAVTGGIALLSYIYSVYCDYKAPKAMSNIKFIGNGVSISF